MKRIKFKEISPGIYESIYILKAKTGALYNVFVNRNDMSYKIKNVNSGRIYVNEKKGLTNLIVLHRHLRAHLTLLGVNIETTYYDKGKV